MPSSSIQKLVKGKGAEFEDLLNNPGNIKPGEENEISGSRKPSGDDHGYKVEEPKKIPNRSIADDDDNRLKTLREVPPTHYALKIESFSLLVRSLAKVGLYTYISKEFRASGYKWTLLLYPGITEEGDGCIHLSLEIMNPPPKEIEALVIFFLYDQHKKRYLSIQDIDSQQFDENKNKQSDPYPIVSLEDFKSTSNGYLVDDKCTFGVEVFVLGSRGKTSARFQTRKPREHGYIWNLNKQSVVKETSKISQPFTIGDYKWKLHLYRKRNEKEKYMSISLCLQMEDQTKFPLGWKMYVEFKLSLKVKDHEISKRGNAWYSAVHTAWGFPKFINLDGLGSDPMQIEVQIISMSMEKDKTKESSLQREEYLMAQADLLADL